MSEELRARAGRLRGDWYAAYRCTGEGLSGACLDDIAAVCDAYLADQAAAAELRGTIALRCGYLLNLCRGEEEMRAEARAILELLEGP